MFIGEYRHTIDSKRRIAIPAKFRKHLGETAVVAKGLEGSLFIYTKEEWQKLAEKLGTLPVGKASTRSFVRMMLAGASEVEVDGLGRVLLPEYLTTHADLQKNVVIAGVFNRIELWNEQRWEEYKKSAQENTDEIAERLGEMGAF